MEIKFTGMNERMKRLWAIHEEVWPKLYNDVINEPQYGSWVAIVRDRNNIIYKDVQHRVSISAGTRYENALNQFLHCEGYSVPDPYEKLEVERKLKKLKIKPDSLLVVDDIHFISAELKFNVSLDTGKTSDTKKRLIAVENVLKEHRNSVFSILVCLSSPIQGLLLKSMPNKLRVNTYGYQEFLAALGISFDETHWNGLIKECNDTLKEKFNILNDALNRRGEQIGL